MKRINIQNSVYLIISIVFGLIGFGTVLLLFLWYGPKKPISNVSESTLAYFQKSTATKIPTKIITESTEQETVPTVDLPTPTPEWMVYDGIDLRNKEVEALIVMACDDDAVYLESFEVIPFEQDVFDNSAFFTEYDFSVAWEHLGYYGMWIHSGLSSLHGELPAYPLQIYLENDDRGYRRYPDDFKEHMEACLIDGEIRLRQDDNFSVSKIVAAIRIPPTDVEDINKHPMDLVPYLAENYPDSGFDQMQPPGMLFYFCGRQLSGESLNDSLDYWTQARIIIGFMPITEE